MSRITVENNWSGGQNLHLANPVHRQVRRARFRVECMDINAAFKSNDGLNGLGGLLEQELASSFQRPGMHPTNSSVKLSAHARQHIQTNDHVTSSNIDVMLEHQCDGLRTKGFRGRTVIGPDHTHYASEAAR